MAVTARKEEFASIAPEERILLLPHCLRPTKGCRGVHTRSGMECPDDCKLPCSIRKLRRAALAAGYKGVCIAPGGKLAMRYVEEKRPRAILAVACDKELEEGVDSVRHLGAPAESLPAVAVVPLTRDGCVDCEVDECVALEMIRAGTKEQA